MATHKSAEKRARQALRRRDRNRAVKSGVRTSIKALRSAVEGGDASAAATQLRATERVLRKAGSKGAFKKKWVSRQISRLSRAVGRTGDGGGEATPTS